MKSLTSDEGLMLVISMEMTLGKDKSENSGQKPTDR